MRPSGVWTPFGVPNRSHCPLYRVTCDLAEGVFAGILISARRVLYARCLPTARILGSDIGVSPSLDVLCVHGRVRPVVSRHVLRWTRAYCSDQGLRGVQAALLYAACHAVCWGGRGTVHAPLTLPGRLPSTLFESSCALAVKPLQRCTDAFRSSGPGAPTLYVAPVNALPPASM
ncbi:hypothetical protein PENSPDRAFT_362522 [Peniophora sp. CONT]|nr:hypothetical protein PENSPDRAFT_362522 [Peniophora sp. CONT]